MDNNQGVYKTCSKCKEPKPADKFYQHKGKRDGLNSYCVDCSRAYREMYYNQFKTGERERVFIKRKGVVSQDRICSTCKQKKPISDFYRNKSGSDGLESQCKYCKDNSQSRWNALRRGDEKRRNKRLRHRRSQKETFVEMLGGGCQRCGYNEFLPGLEFHHVDPKQKQYGPSTLMKRVRYETVYKELDKCILLCASCHNAFEVGLWSAEFIKRDGLGYSLKIPA